MANLDYVEAAGATSVSEVAGLVAEIFDARIIDSRNLRLNPDERTWIEIYTDPDSDATVLIAVRYLGELEPRRECARKIFDALADRTRWSLLHTSDDAEGDGVLARHAP